MRKICTAIILLCLVFGKTRAAVDLTLTGTVIPTSMYRGISYQISVTVQNTGSTPTSISFPVNISINTASTYNGSQQYLTDIIFTGGLAAGATRTLSTTITIPCTYSTGTRYILVGVNPNVPPRAVTESDYSDNDLGFSFLLQTAPDLVPLNYSLSTSSISAGNTLNANFAVNNLGGSSATAFTAGFYLSTSTTFNIGSATLLGSQSISSLASCAQTTLLAKPLTIPVSVCTGTYYLFIWVDNGQAISEVDNNNNFQYISLSVTGTTPPAPVATFGDASNPSTFTTSLTPTLTWTGSGSVYWLQISKCPYGSGNIIYSASCISGTSHSLSSGNLEPGRLYRWNMYAGYSCCISGQSPLSNTRYFSTTPVITVGGSNTICPGGTTTLQTDFYAEASYQWKRNGVNVSGATSSTYLVSQTGNYSVVVSYSSCGLSVESSVFPISSSACCVPTNQASNITFQNNSGISVDINWNSNSGGTSRIVKINTINSFTNPINGQPPTIVNNNYGGSGEQTVYYSSGSNVQVTGLTPGQTYYFHVYEANCSGSQIVYNTNSGSGNPASVTMVSGPIAEFATTTPIIIAGQSTQFIDLSSNNPTQWQWRVFKSGIQGSQTQQGGILTTQHPVVTFNSSGCYRVELTASNASGSDVEIKNCFIYVKPNATATVPADVAMSLQYNSYYGGDPVNTAMGLFSYQQADIATRGINTQLSIERRYSNRITLNGQFGFGWYYDFGMRLLIDEFETTLIKGDGSAFKFQLYPNGEARCLTPIFNDSLYYVNNAGNYTYTYVEKNGTKWDFNNSGLLISKRDLNNNLTQIIRSGIQIDRIIVPGGRELQFTHDANNKITSIRNGIDTIFYYYNPSGQLLDSVKIRDARTWYKYNATTNNLEEIISPNGHRIIKNEYTGDRVTKQWDAFDVQTQFQYDVPTPGSTTIINGLNKLKVVTHDANYLITKEVNEIGHTRRYTHTPEHYIDSLIDERGYGYKFHTKQNGDVEKTTDPLLQSDSIAYINFSKPSYIRDKEGNATIINYSATLNPIQITQANTGIHTIDYNQYGQDTTATDPLNKKTRKRYSTQGDLTKIIRPLSIDSFQYDGVGRPVVHINPRGVSDSITYNHYNQPLRITDALGFAETFEYDANGNLVKHTDKEGIETVNIYDAKDRLLRVIRGGIIHKEYVWNELDHLIKLRDGNRNCLIFTNDDLGRTTLIADSVLGTIAEYTYDAASNRNSYKNSLGSIWLQRYDELNRLVSTKNPLNDSVRIKYNKNNQPTEYIDEEGKSTKLTYNSMGVHIKTVDKNNASILIHPNLIGLPDSIRDAKGFYRRITYDDEYRVIATNEGYGNHQYLYDSTGNLVEYRDLASNILNWTFNNRDEKLEERWNGVSKKSFTYNKNGWLTLASNQGNSLYKFYDNNGWVIKDSSTFGGRTLYQRDSVGNIKRTTLNDGKQIVNTYNSLNYNTGITDWNNNSYSIVRDKEGGIVSQVYPNNTQLTVSRNNAYQVTGWINSKISPTEIFQKNNPLYTKRGEVSGDTSTINYFPKLTITPGYHRSTYSSADRKLTHGAGTYTYNGNGSVTSINDTAFIKTFTYFPDNSTEQVSHNGITTVNTFDVFSNRVERIRGPDIRRYNLSYEFADNPVVLQELDNNNSPVITNLFTPEGLLLARDSSGTVTFYHHNLYGNTTALSNPAGNITDTYAYLLFGNSLTHTGNSSQAYTWQGMYGVQSEGNDIYYIWQRYYDANTGAFLSKDPIQSVLTDTRSLNSYLYGLNDPLSYSDPTGLYPMCVIPKENNFGVAGYDPNKSFWQNTKNVFIESWNDSWNRALTTFRNPQTYSTAFELALLLAPGPKFVKGGVAAKTGGQSLVQANRAAGNLFRDELASGLRAEGRVVNTEVFKRTPFGKRYIDIDVWHNGVNLGGIEAKVGGSRYLPLQRLKDAWLGANGYPVQLVRKPKNW